MKIVTRLVERLRFSLIPVADSPQHLVNLRHAVQSLVVDNNEQLALDGPVIRSVSRLESSYKVLLEASKQFCKEAGRQFDLNEEAAELGNTAQAIIDNQTTLNAWCSWCRVREEALSNGLKPFVHAIENGTLPSGSVIDNFEVAYARWFASEAIDDEPLLRRFVPVQHQSDIELYRAAVDKLSELASTYIRAKLTGEILDKDRVEQMPGFAVLRHELQKKRQHKPVRQLVQEMGDSFTFLAPCMLMSPLSVAQYLPAGHELFDLVIFDEASQITPCDAVGAIARGKQVVVAGDPKQMPPTSFFNRGRSAVDDETSEDLESVLDECLAAGLHQHSLNWHYRSRHESLITFSNYHYYGGNLITFPASDTRPSVVTWRPVDGVYSRGKGRQNQVEAKAIVAEVVKRLTDAEFLEAEQSIGIITLNIYQQQLIEDLLDQAQKQYPSIEPFFTDNLTEPVIVKNLENMQGDERDLILLGIGFGPTEPEANIMSMDFGPLNREGGWRRLNVALTRARREMMIFTSFEPSMIDFNRTSARAVHDLRHFIEFADRGPKTIATAVRGSVGDYESPFEQCVAEGLRNNGWEVHTQIGVSRFRIDLGVVHPDRPGDYLVGVECDGATYHSAATARDRDKVREEILRGLGWDLIRVWSTAWWVDRKGALRRLDQAINEALEQSREQGAELDQQREEAAAAMRVAEEGIATVGDGVESASGDDEQAMDSGVGNIQDNGFYPGVPVARNKVNSNFEAPSKHTYCETDLSEFGSVLEPDNFHEPSYNSTLEAMIRRVLEQEAPILDKVLVDRLARAHGFMRSGRLIRERVLGLARADYYFQPDPQPDHGNFVWMSPDAPEHWSGYRTPDANGSPRSIEEIPCEEIIAAARDIVSGDRATEIARLFGIRRLSATARDRIEQLLVSKIELRP